MALFKSSQHLNSKAGLTAYQKRLLKTHKDKKNSVFALILNDA